MVARDDGGCIRLGEGRRMTGLTLRYRGGKAGQNDNPHQRPYGAWAQVLREIMPSRNAGDPTETFRNRDI